MRERLPYPTIAWTGFLIQLVPAVAGAIELPAGFSDTRIAGGLNPSTMMFAPDGRLFVNEKNGRIRVIKNDALLPTPFATVETDPVNERGLLGIDFDPDFEKNQYVYVFYTTRSTPARNRISRFTAKGDVAAGPETVIFDMDDLTAAGNHNGGTIGFGKDGKLYIAQGNNAVGSAAQSMSTTLGKLLRINPDGSIPSDNPFAGSTTGRNRAIWALGFRNPFTFGIQPGTGRIFVNDVGGSAYEEVAEVRAGENHGFPKVEGNSGTPPTEPGAYKAPVLTYSHSGGGCAISGGTFFNPPRSTFPGEFTGQYFYADYCGGWIKAANPAKANAVTGFATGIAGPVNVQVSPDGYLYYLTRGTSKSGSVANTATTAGEVHKIKGPVPVALPAPRWERELPEGTVVSMSGKLRLMWPAGSARAVLFEVTGRTAGILARPSAAPSAASSHSFAEGIYHVLYLP